MKAKDYAEALLTKSRTAAVELEHAPVADFELAVTRLGANAVVELMKEMQVAVSKTRSDQAMYGAFREGLTKWKSVVRLVHEDYPDHPVSVNYIGLFLAMSKPDVFETLVANKVFLGYEFSAKEQTILDDLKCKRMSASHASDFDVKLAWLVNRMMLGGRIK